MERREVWKRFSVPTQVNPPNSRTAIIVDVDVSATFWDVMTRKAITCENFVVYNVTKTPCIWTRTLDKAVEFIVAH